MKQSTSDESGFHTSGCFMLRTPSLPWSFFFDRDRWPESASEMRTLLSDTLLLEDAIALASPPLYRTMQRLPELDRDEQTKALQSFRRYAFRMATRCTPFGLFAGVTVGTAGTSTSLVLQGPESGRRVCRLSTLPPPRP